jgi:hypothetical protein
MELFGYVIPLWAVFLLAIVIAIFAWKIIKFAVKVLIILVVLFAIFMGLDYFQVFSWMQGILASFM